MKYPKKVRGKVIQTPRDKYGVGVQWKGLDKKTHTSFIYGGYLYDVPRTRRAKKGETVWLTRMYGSSGSTWWIAKQRRTHQ